MARTVVVCIRGVLISKCRLQVRILKVRPIVVRCSGKQKIKDKDFSEVSTQAEQPETPTRGVPVAGAVAVTSCTVQYYK